MASRGLLPTQTWPCHRSLSGVGAPARTPSPWKATDPRASRRASPSPTPGPGLSGWWPGSPSPLPALQGTPLPALAAAVSTMRQCASTSIRSPRASQAPWLRGSPRGPRGQRGEKAAASTERSALCCPLGWGVAFAPVPGWRHPGPAGRSGRARGASVWRGGAGAGAQAELREGPQRGSLCRGHPPRDRLAAPAEAEPGQGGDRAQPAVLLQVTSATPTPDPFPDLGNRADAAFSLPLPPPAARPGERAASGPRDSFLELGKRSQC